MYLFNLIHKGKIYAGPEKIIKACDFAKLIEATDILEAAKVGADNIRKESKIEIENAKKEAEEKGFEEGLTKLNEVIIHYENQIKTLRIEMQKSILPLSLKATKRIVGELLEINPETVVHIVSQAIKSVASSKHIKIFINKQDFPTIEAEKEKIKKIIENLESFTLEERPGIEKGSCIIETEKGILNATLENQFRALERAFEIHKRRR